jgi:Xaa-Pro aminopeptidase
MRYSQIDKQLFVKNREKFRQYLKPNSLAVLNSNDIMPTSADGHFAFQQHSDIFYLSGIDQEESILVIFPDFVDSSHREILFLRETNEEIAVWEGEKLSKEQAREVSGIQTIYWLQDFPRVWRELVFQAENIYLNTNEHLRASVEVETRDARFLRWCMEKHPLHKYERLQPILHRIRAVKSEEEIALIRHACKITEQGFRRLLSFVKPNVWEYEIEAELIHEFVRSRSKGFAYTPIIASGANACVLHYIENNKQCKDGDLLLLDIAAEYANYNSDLTRCIPVNGRFTPRQKAVYNAVLRVHDEAKKLLAVGNNWIDYHKEVGKIMESELIGLGLLKKHEVEKQNPAAPLYKKYFPHGTSHHLGLNVHDYGNKYHTFEAGMVFTCEPGIYIREEGLGIRIENDIVIRANGQEDLMATIPITVEEIEELMNA